MLDCVTVIRETTTMNFPYYIIFKHFHQELDRKKEREIATILLYYSSQTDDIIRINLY